MLVVDAYMHFAVFVDGLLDDQVVAVDKQLPVAVVYQCFNIDFFFDRECFLASTASTLRICFLSSTESLEYLSEKRNSSAESCKTTNVDVALSVAVLSDDDVGLLVDVRDDHISVAFEVVQDQPLDLH